VRLLAALAVLLAVSGCATTGRNEAPGPASEPAPPVVRHSPAPATASPPGKGGYYKDDGPGENPPKDLASIPDAVPRPESPLRAANRPYQVFGKDYVPMSNVAPFRQTGIGSWYGKRFNGALTSSGEPYDMYAMTAAHPTLPIPSYARVTNLANGRSVVVRINDRGPFHSDRIIDLSYTAAWKLGYADAGSARVEVESIVPGSPSPAGTAVAKAEPKQEPRQQPKQEPEQQQETKGVYLQLGAFSAREAAENFRVRVYRELTWLSQAIQIVAGGSVFRLHLGPYHSQDEARSIADRIQSELNLRPVIVSR
jgi:rare lipoprotein A